MRDLSPPANPHLHFETASKAVVDRITHKAHIIDTGTESWRFRHGLERKGSRRS
jgi:hypothetical protein